MHELGDQGAAVVEHGLKLALIASLVLIAMQALGADIAGALYRAASAFGGG